MKNLLYLEFVRNKKSCVRMLRRIVIFLAMVYVFAVIVDTAVPECNQHMQFPDMMRNFLSLYEWQEELYSNLWCIFAVICPFFFLYHLMTGFSGSLWGERGGTENRYIGEMGESSGQALLSKMGIWVIRSFAFCSVLFVENAVFFLFLDNEEMIGITGWYCVRLFAVSFLYLALTLFLASCSAEAADCEELCLVVLLLPVVLARIYTWIQLFADQTIASYGRLPNAERIYAAVRRLSSLQILAPVIWCYPGTHFPVAYGLCGFAVTVVLGVTGYSIFTDYTSNNAAGTEKNP